MSGTFTPRLDVLPSAQRDLWPELRGTAERGLVLYDGTAIALRLGHRQSVDFDFFSDQSLERASIRAAFPFLAAATTIQDEPSAWSVLVPSKKAGCGDVVKISFFGTINMGRVGEPDFTEDGVLRVASLDDLMAAKLKVMLQRAEAKDYRDVSAMVQAGVSLQRGLAAARVMYGPNFQPSESLKALVYFGDGDLNTLTALEKDTLIQAVKTVHDLPAVTIQSRKLSD